MKILVVSLSYPPLNNPQSIRWRALSKLLAKQGIDLEVLSLKLPFADFTDINSNFNIRRIYSPITGFLLKKFLLSGDRIKNSYLRVWLLKLYEIFSFGDAFIDWGIRTSYELAKISNDYHRIIFSCEPHIATLLPTFFVNNKKVILDLADPPIPNYFLGTPIFPFKQIHEIIFYLALKRAQKVIFTGYGVKEFYEDKYPFLKGKSFVITQGFPKELYYYSLSKPQTSNNPPVLSFVGNFIDNIREPTELINAVSKLNIKFVYVGKIDRWSNFLKRKLGSRFIFLGRKSNEEALKVQLNSDVLIYIGNKVPYQQSGKLYEYLGSNKPILAIIQNKKDDAIRLIEKFKCGIVCKNSEEEIFISVKKILLNKHRFLNSRKDYLKLNYCWDTLARKYKYILESP